MDKRITEIEREIKNTSFKVNQARIFLKLSILKGIDNLIDFDNYLKIDK